MLQPKTVEQSTLELLKELMRIAELKEFFLVGGTNLSLRLGHRISVDLDLFTDEPFDPEFIQEVLENHFTDLKIILKNRNTLLGYLNGVKVDFVLYRYGLIHPIEELEGVRMASIPDIAAMKLNAISRRGVKKDYWDFAELLKLYSVNEMLNFYAEKHKTTDIAHIIRSLVYFEDAEYSDHPMTLNEMTWEKAKKLIQEKVKDYIKSQTAT